MARDIPLRKSLLARLLAVSVVVSIGSIAATTWLAAQTTSGALRQEQGQVLADDARIYDKLLEVGAGAPEWRGADEAVHELARTTGRRIALTTQDRKVIADSADPPKRSPASGRAGAEDNSAASDGASADSGAGKGGSGKGSDSGKGGSRKASGDGDGGFDKGSGSGEDTSGKGSGDSDSDSDSDRDRDRDGDTGSGSGSGKGSGSRSDGPRKGVDSGSGKGSGPGQDARGNQSHAPLPPTASAVLDPLSVDKTLAPDRGEEDAAADRIDPRAVGPFGLPEKERGWLKQAADRSVSCLAELGLAAEAVVGPTGRPFVRVDSDPAGLLQTQCRPPLLDVLTATEQKALDKLNSLTDACMKRRGLAPVTVTLDPTGRSGPRAIGPAVPVPPSTEPVPGGTPTGPGSLRPAPTEQPDTTAAGAATASCVDTARREQLGPYVSSPALLFITSSDGTRSAPAFSLSRANTIRLAGLAAAVLAVTVAITALAATRLTRPLRALTTATRRMKAGEAAGPVPARATRSAGEISQLADAFYDMAAHRKALEEQRKAMVSDVAHELRTPLSNIRGWLEAAEDGVVDTDPELVTSLLEEALLLQHIVDDLQDLAAADAGTLRLHREPVRAAEIADQVAAAHQARADAAGVRLRATAFGDPWVTADPLRLRQAIGNLVSNAVRHTPEGGSVRVSCRTTPDAVLIEVADTGTGIDPDDLPHVFDRFWRADKSRTRATGGSGLGLSIVRKLVEAHEGTVTAESVPGKGSLFTVRLPVA
ncbi:ATP-binding protein [Streptomyces sp. NPDC047123]|uniref:sensor histidine kinase n=1 Tax=Streptomyces sp. NPDC047123 TaxID=3155622 RepID=UPI0033C3DC68